MEQFQRLATEQMLHQNLLRVRVYLHETVVIYDRPSCSMERYLEATIPVSHWL